jgi:hypothetical protein
MILTRTMKELDYECLKTEGEMLVEVQKAIQMWYPPQHKHRLWEYTMALKALRAIYPQQQKLSVSDMGCAGSFLSPMMAWYGHNVSMYEIWQFGDLREYTMEQMTRVHGIKGSEAGSYKLHNRGMCGLLDEDRGLDVAFCISTLEHIPNYQAAWIDLLNTVKLGGLVFITTDFAEDETDHYQYNYLRAGKMFNWNTYMELITIGKERGFSLLGNGHDLYWSEACRLVHDYGFGSLAMVKEK